MKKIIALLLVLTMTVGLMTACGSKAGQKADPLKTGLAVITLLGSSKNATEGGEGLAQIDSFIAAVLVDAAGKIVDCKIDTVQTKVKFSAEGKLLTDVSTVFKTKQELGTEYGMKKASDIGKEWNEQADFFAKYVIGKTVDEIKGIAVNESGVAADADIAAGITVHINDFINGVAKAVANAKDLGASKGDKLGLGVYSDIANSKDATADAAGLAQAYTYYTATTFDKDGKITSSVIDASQGNVNFDATGTITTDLTVAPQTKQELKEAYNMKKASGIGKEWYEQANSFADYVKGKTVADVKGIALTEGRPSNADLAASVTVHVNGFQTIIEKAYSNSAK